MKQGWEIKKLGEVAIFVNGDRGKNYPSQHDFVDDGVPFINAGHLVGGSIDFASMNYISEEKYNQLGAGKIVNGDILFCLRGSLGKRAIVKDVNYGAIASSLVIIRSKNVLLNRYLFHYLGSQTVQNLITKNDNGSSQPNLSAKSVSDFSIPIPPREEQERIVAELDCLSGIIERKREQLRELDALAQSIFYQMFGDPITNEKGWEIDRLGNMCDISSSKRIYAHEYCEDGIPFYRGKEITEKSKGNDISVELYIAEDRYNELKHKYGVPQIGDILITAVGTIGNIWVVDNDTPFYFKDGNVLWLQIKDNINPIYFKTLLYNLIDKYKESMANGCAYSALTIVNLKEMQTNKIPFALQQEFANRIEKIEQQKELIKKSIAEVEDLFNSRMSYYFN